MELHDWSVWQPENFICITGKVYGNPNFRDGKIVTTSAVETFDTKNMKIKTRNSTYDLKRPEIRFMKDLESRGKTLMDFHTGDIP